MVPDGCWRALRQSKAEAEMSVAQTSPLGPDCLGERGQHRARARAYIGHLLPARDAQKGQQPLKARSSRSFAQMSQVFQGHEIAQFPLRAEGLTQDDSGLCRQLDAPFEVDCRTG